MPRKAVYRTLRKVMTAFRAPNRRGPVAQDEPAADTWIRFHKGETIEVPLPELNDYHLLHALSFLEQHAELFQKKTVEEGVSAAHIIRRQQSLDYSASAIQKIKRMTPNEYLETETIYPKLRWEAIKRGFSIPPLDRWGQFEGEETENYAESA